MTELLPCETVEDFARAGKVGKYFGQKSAIYDMWMCFYLFIESGTEETTARPMALLNKMSRNDNKFVVLGGGTSDISDTLKA